MSIVNTIIEFQYNNSIQQSQELEKISASLKKIAGTQIDEAIQAISQNWKGENASAYLAKTQETEHELMHLAVQLEATSNAISKIAKNLYEAETKALSLASERKYGS